MKARGAVEAVVGWNAEPQVPMGIDLPLRAMHRGLIAVIVLLLPVNFFVGYLKYLDYEDSEQPLAAARFFDFGEELAFPAWLAAGLLLIASFTALAAAQRTIDDPIVRRGWRITAGALAYVSLDEATYLHERIGHPVGSQLGIGGIFTWAWVVPGIVIVALLAVRLWPFIQRLPKPTRELVLLSAGLFVGCALGIEMIDGLVYDLNDDEANVITEVLTMIEESGELLAVMLFIDAAANHTARLARAGGDAGTPSGESDQSVTTTVVDSERPNTSGS